MSEAQLPIAGEGTEETEVAVPEAPIDDYANPDDMVYGDETSTPLLDETLVTTDAANANKWHQNGYGDVVPKQSGKFSREESDTIKNAIEKYCETKQISVKALCSEREHKADLKGAWMEIARYLPDRSVQSVYRHGIRQCHPFKRGAWSEAEVSMLQDLVTHNGKKWSMIQTKLNRSADSCRDKYREMSDEFVKGRWEDAETMDLIGQIRCWLHHHTNGATSTLVDFQEMAQLVDEMKIQIPWSLISKRMGRRSRLSCFKKWQKLTNETDAAAFRTSDERPSKRPKLLSIPEQAPPQPQEEQQQVTEYIVPMTDAHVAEAELAAETVEALGLPDLIASKNDKVGG